jgi:DNA-binding transcriptional MerR regulator/effector-binding domain-containing protein
MDESSLLSIRDFSDFTGVNQSTLRYYDEIGLLPAAWRGENNYRYYTPFQIIKLNYINVLIELGIPLSAIKEMDQVRTPENVTDLLSRQEVKLDRRLDELRSAYSIIHTYRNNIQHGLMARDGLIRIEELDEKHYVLGGVNNFIDGDTFYNEFIRFCKSADENRINLRYPVGGFHDSFSAFTEASGRPSRYFSLDPIGNNVQPGGKYLVAYKQGFYGEFGDVAQRMTDCAEELELIFTGPVFVVYLLDEISMTEPEQYLSQIISPVSPRNAGKKRKV